MIVIIMKIKDKKWTEHTFNIVILRWSVKLMKIILYYDAKIGLIWFSLTTIYPEFYLLLSSNTKD